MNSTNILEPIWSSYQATLDCLKVASKGIDAGDIRLMNKTGFLDCPVDKAKEMIKETRTSADDFIVVSLWAVFERKLFEYLQTEGGKIFRRVPTGFNEKFYVKIERDMEYWRIDDVLDLFKSVVSAELIGRAKQIKDYRNSVVHKNPKKGSPTNVIPETAYEILSTIILQLEQCPDFN